MLAYPRIGHYTKHNHITLHKIKKYCIWIVSHLITSKKSTIITRTISYPYQDNNSMISPTWLTRLNHSVKGRAVAILQSGQDYTDITSTLSNTIQTRFKYHFHFFCGLASTLNGVKCHQCDTHCAHPRLLPVFYWSMAQSLRNWLPIHVMGGKIGSPMELNQQARLRSMLTTNH